MFKIKHSQKDRYQPSVLKYDDSDKDVDSFIKSVREEANSRTIVEIGGKKVVFGVEGPILLKMGKFWSIAAHIENGKWGTHFILISPNLKDIIDRGECFIRLDSGCFSGVLGDTTCDCVEQLKIAQEMALEKGGVIVHIPEQDGRGWREYKMANQRIMHETKLDTITTAVKFYGREEIIDIRTFDEAALILKALGFPKNYKFDLGTKNPKKTNALMKAGFSVATQAIEAKNKSKNLDRNLKAKYRFFKSHKKG